MTTALQQVRDLLADHTRWTKDALARPAHDRRVICPGDPEATCWCLDGALRKVADSSVEYVDAQIALNTAVRALFPDRITGYNSRAAYIEFNDHRETTHDDIMEVLNVSGTTK